MKQNLSKNCEIKKKEREKLHRENGGMENDKMGPRNQGAAIDPQPILLNTKAMN